MRIPKALLGILAVTSLLVIRSDAAVNVTLNGTSYSIPEPGDTGWGQSLTDYLVATAPGFLQKAGGNFTLTADADFGASFGLRAPYFRSHGGSPAVSGVIRLGNGDGVNWRNVGNTADLSLIVDNANNLSFNGVPIASSSGVVPPTAGGTGISTYTTGDTLYASASNVLSKLGVGSSGDVYNVTGGIPAWSKITNSSLSGSAAISNANLASMSNNTLKGNVSGGSAVPTDLTATQATTILNSFVGDSGSGGTKGLVPAPAAGDAAAAKFLKANGTWSVPTGSGTVTSVAMTVPSGLTVSGSPITASGTLAITASGQFAASQMPAFTGDITTSAGAVATTAAATQANIVTLSKSTGVSVHGTNTNDSAAAGYFGEYIESVISSATNVPAASSQYGDATSISLTAGDWDVTFSVLVNTNGATSTQIIGGISTTSGNSSTGLVTGSNALASAGPTSGNGASVTVANYRVSLSGTTTHYAKLFVAYTVATPQYTCRLSARRVR